MIKFLFIRHGQTEWNISGKFQGTLNSPLTEIGINQAKKLHLKLVEKNTDFSSVYSSPLGRAYQTAKIISNDQSSILPLPEFQEISLGDMEGFSHKKFEDLYPEEYYNFSHNPELYNPSSFNGESYQELLPRIEDGLNNLLSLHQSGDTVIVVTHGVTLRAICSYISNSDKKLSLDLFTKHPVPENTSVTTAIYENEKWTLLDFSNVEHLN